MSYRILEKRFYDRKGDYIEPSDFYVVDETGKKFSNRFGSRDEAISELLSLEAKDKLEAEKTRTSGPSLGR